MFLELIEHVQENTIGMNVLETFRIFLILLQNTFTHWVIVDMYFK